MASFFTCPSPILILILSLILIFVSPSCSVPRRFLDHQTTTQTGFKLNLVHVDSGKNLTNLERIRLGMKRSQLRLQHFHTTVLDKSGTSNISSPVSAGKGAFYMNLSIGTPPLPFSALMDTGSDLIWTQCEPCENCFSQPTPLFNPEKSSSYSKLACSSRLCQALESPTCNDGCQYQYSYGDRSSTQGVMATETFTFDSVPVSNIGFGCGENNEFTGPIGGAGLVGLGRGSLSLVSQLKEPKFSYCLTSIGENQTSTLLMGSLAKVPRSSSKDVKTTPLISNPSRATFYYLSLKGITVGDTRLPINDTTFDIDEDGNGGLIIDSGTTLTLLEDSAFELVSKAFISQTKLEVDSSDSDGLLCFKKPEDTSHLEVPRLVFHFQEADLEFPSENYLVTSFKEGVLCLAMASSNQQLSIFGNVQQQNMLVVHDLVQENLSFVPMQCGKI